MQKNVIPWAPSMPGMYLWVFKLVF